MKYALLAYSALAARDRTPAQARREIPADIAAVLARPEVAGWIRLQDVESATTVRNEEGNTLLTDGPFVDSKEFLGGLIIVEAHNLDGALAVAAELQKATRFGGAIEVRPILEQELGGA